MLGLELLHQRQDLLLEGLVEGLLVPARALPLCPRNADQRDGEVLQALARDLAARLDDDARVVLEELGQRLPDAQPRVGVLAPARLARRRRHERLVHVVLVVVVEDALGLEVLGRQDAADNARPQDHGPVDLGIRLALLIRAVCELGRVGHAAVACVGHLDCDAKEE